MMTFCEVSVYEVSLSWVCVGAAVAVSLILVAALIVGLIVAGRAKRRED